MKPYLLYASIIALTISACAKQDTLNLKGRATWLKYQNVVEAAAKGQRIDAEEFNQAADFFERVAGITIPGGHSLETYWYPTKETAQAVGPLRRWYRANGDRLYWDQEAGRVRVRS